jgi:hypothetical protein
MDITPKNILDERNASLFGGKTSTDQAPIAKSTTGQAPIAKSTTLQAPASSGLRFTPIAPLVPRQTQSTQNAIAQTQSAPAPPAPRPTQSTQLAPAPLSYKQTQSAPATKGSWWWWGSTYQVNINYQATIKFRWSWWGFQDLFISFFGPGVSVRDDYGL